MLEAACAVCESNREYEPSTWFTHINWLYRLQRAGYPFGTDDLDIEEWLALSEIRDAMEEIKAGVK